ncbi:MAG: Holliday junction branch migration protein RuvA [Oscillospiraceae bacterium]|jgi:Holliday junction DNA helicase RuvA|nr:Holliday junction branch migration protein RuvA [Oscillospiraceae bacterium]
MIAFLEGTVIEKRAPGDIVINVGGVGFQLSCSAQTLSTAPGAGAPARIHTRMIVREDGIELYGFMAAEERAMFDMLRSVGGIGSRTALAVLSTMNVTELNRAIALSDAAAISRAPGVGKKTAQRVILDLKDKLAPTNDFGGETDSISAYTGQSAEREAIAGLVSLGYTASEAQRAVARASDGADSLNIKSDELIRRALKRINA